MNQHFRRRKRYRPRGVAATSDPWRPPTHQKEEYEFAARRGGVLASWGKSMSPSDGRQCDLHERCVLIFRSSTTLPDGLRRRSREYGHRAWPIQLRKQVPFELQLVFSDAGPLVTLECASYCEKAGPPLLDRRQTQRRVTYFRGFRVVVVWTRPQEGLCRGFMEIEQSPLEGDAA